MLILTNGLTDIADEGFLKVANNLIKKIKSKDTTDVYVVTYERSSKLSDRHINANKLLLNRELISIIRKRKEEVLYIPFPARSIATSLRIFILSLFSSKGLRVIWVQKSSLNFLSKMLIRLSCAKIVVLSRDSKDHFSKVLKADRIFYLKTGVDTKKFAPVSPEVQKFLKRKYSLDPERPVVLHVGHLKQGRNMAQLLKLDPNNQILIVLSTLFKNDADEELRDLFMNVPNVFIIEEYLPDIQEVYQLSDVYFFPVVNSGNCIDVPLSCLEAASCNKPIVTTAYGEMKEFSGKDGFFFIDSFDKERLNQLIREGLNAVNTDVRSSIIEYDWEHSVSMLK